MTSPTEPLSSEILDELISAELDGELERAVADLELDPQVARDALTTPAAQARRDALTRARELLATPPPLENARARELALNALAAADARSVTQLPRRRSGQAWRVVAGVAATAAVLAGVVAIASNGSGGGKTSMSAATSPGANAASGTTAPRQRAANSAIEFGDVTNAPALRAAVGERLRNAAAGSLPSVHVPEAAGATSGGSKRATVYAPAASADSTKTQLRLPRASCIAAFRRAAQLGPAALTGTGTSAGRPVYVAVFAVADGNVAYVLSASDCAVVLSTPVP